MNPVFRMGAIAVALSSLTLPPAIGSTPARVPLEVESNESTGEQLATARFEGDAVQQSWDSEKPELRGGAAEQSAGEYHLILTLTAPEGWYEPGGNGLVWREPPTGGVHLRVVVRDGGDGRTVPGLQVFASIDRGPEQPLPFGWYPLLNGYGANLAGAADVSHDVRVRIARACFRRHDPYNGDRFTDETVADFAGLQPAAGGTVLSAVEERHAGAAGTQGGAMGRAVRDMRHQATSAASLLTGDYRIEEAVEFAEAYWRCEGPRFVYTTEAEMSSAENCHVEIAPRDAASGRFMPEIPVTVTVLTGDGHALGTRVQPLMWHPWLYHYGENWRVPHSGREYRVRASFPVPSWRRYGRINGRRFAQEAEVEFQGVAIKSGEK